MRWFDVEPCYVFHPMNAYDDGDTVVLDVVRHTSMFDTHLLGPDEGPPTLERWSLDLVGGKVVEERLDDRGQEFPPSTSASSDAGAASATPVASLESESALMSNRSGPRHQPGSAPTLGAGGSAGASSSCRTD